MKTIRLLTCVTLFISLAVFGSSQRLQAAEFGANTSYYEDDGWLDITEWFDGNDYNPTDEAWWRWDDEVYEASEDVAGDSDSDMGYGYSARDDDDWYYDYYNPGPYGYYDYDDNDLYEFGSRYYDYDNDGTYDAYVTYSDWDGDGLYDDYDYYSFADTGTDAQQQRAKEQAPRESRQHAVTGQIQKMKLVQVQAKKHVMVEIQQQQPKNQQQQAQQQGRGLIVDLGEAEKIKDLNLQLGSEITVRGPRTQIGERSLVLAKSLESQGQTVQIDRQRRQIQGNVVSTRRANVRGAEHLVAIVEVPQQEGSQQRDRLAVDFGPADKLQQQQINVSQGSQITFTGVPIKVQGRRLMLAQQIKTGNDFVQIDRRPSQAEGTARTAAERTGPTTQPQQQEMGQQQQQQP